MVMVQIRHVPENVHRELRVRAAREGRSLSEYLLAELVRLTSRPTLDELADRVRARDVVHRRPDEPVVEYLDAERTARDEHLTGR